MVFGFLLGAVFTAAGFLADAKGASGNEQQQTG